MQSRSPTAEDVQSLVDAVELTPGPPGLSAYEVAVVNGFNGSEAQWIASLRGPGGGDGDDGKDGASAYQIAVAQGFVGDVNAWLASLKGTNGLSAYQVAVANGFVGTEAQWLESLKATGGGGGGYAALYGSANQNILVVPKSSAVAIPFGSAMKSTDSQVLDWDGSQIMIKKLLAGMYRFTFSALVGIRDAGGNNQPDWSAAFEISGISDDCRFLQGHVYVPSFPVLSWRTGRVQSTATVRIPSGSSPRSVYISPYIFNAANEYVDGQINFFTGTKIVVERIMDL